MQKAVFSRIQENFCHSAKIDPEKLKNEKKEKKQLESILYIQHNKNVLEIVLNEPKKLNTLDIKMIRSMLKRVMQWLPENRYSSATDEENATDSERPGEEVVVPKVVIMKGAGGKSFCAGGDLFKFFNTKTKKDKEISNKKIKDYFRNMYLMNYHISRIKPVQVAIWNGYVMGDGVGVSINAPIRIATDNSIFAMPESAIGFFPDAGSSYFLPRVFNNNHAIGLFMGLTGYKIKGRDLAKCGVATHFVSSDKLDKLKYTIIEESNNHIDLEKLHQIVQEFSEIVYSPDEFSFPKSDEISRTFIPDDLNEIYTRLNRLVDNCSEGEKEWATKVINTLNTFSPLSLVITLEQLKRGIKIKSLEEAYNMEAQMVSA